MTGYEILVLFSMGGLTAIVLMILIQHPLFRGQRKD